MEACEFEAYWEPVPNLLHSTAPGPPLAAPQVSIPVIPSLEALNAVLVLSDDKLFFIGVSIGPDFREWRLVQLDFETSVRLSPSCMLTGRYLFEFYLCHPSVSGTMRLINVIGFNTSASLTYFTQTRLVKPILSSLQPHPASRDFASWNKFVSARQFVHLLHEDTFIHGPFNFATITNRKTRNRIAMTDGKILESYKHLVKNEVPPFEVPAYSVHVDAGIHLCFHNSHNADMLMHR